MIFKKLRKLLNEFRNRDEEQKLQYENIKLQMVELEWAHIFHDTIKDKQWLNELALSPGRWAANYSFLYILVRILSDYKPKKMIEFGLGESSKVVSAFLDHQLTSSSHLIIEQDEKWISAFNSRFTLSEKSLIMHIPLAEKNIKGFAVQSYKNIGEKVDEIFDLYIVDGPFGSKKFSRYDICVLAEKLMPGNEFVIIIDDYNRQGENDTAVDLINIFAGKNIRISQGVYAGNKSQLVIATEKYRFAASM